MKVLFAVAEAYPFAKVGGLADVGGALPKALARRGHEVRLVLPRYPALAAGKRVRSLRLPLGDRSARVDVRHGGSFGGVELYTVGNRTYFGREQIYGYDDDHVRFILFSKAVAAIAARFAWTPDVIHVHDWHTALVPQLLREGSFWKTLDGTATVLTLHNLAYQGPLDPEAEALLGLNGSFRGNLLSRGIAFADAVNTVSQTYLEEILTPANGMGLHGLLRSRRASVRGILNGVDYDEFDPASDPYLAAQYDASSFDGRRRNKLALQEQVGLPLDPEVPLLGLVCRLVDQKGLDLLCASLDELAEMGLQVVVVGDGEERYRAAVARAVLRYPAAIAHPADTGEGIARMVYAGSDLFLAPSIYEPCGLAPLIALRYGSIPVVRRTGGLAETIRDYTRDQRNGFGFTFVPKYPRDLVATVKIALAVYREPERWRRLQRRAMGADFSWGRSVREYERMYREAQATRVTRLAASG